ncbi:MAG TPA: hypothetical protein VFJ97_00250 [Dermatophilaceae bacterium]|nr:hypothetical protein [Dermatophilaceae bacterium]
MNVLPVSVRLALWASAALGGRLPVADVVGRAHPDVDAVDGDLDRISLWQDLGERVVLVALPRPGDVTGMPRSSPELLAAATAAGECVYVPGLGGALVPTVAAYGPVGDRGTLVTWTAYEAEPVPPHRVEAMSLAEADLQLRLSMREITGELDHLDVRPFAGDPARSRVEARLADRGWGLPEGVPPRATQVLSTAARMAAAAETALEAASPALVASADASRQALLRQLRALADSTLAVAANVAALHLAGLRR